MNRRKASQIWSLEGVHDDRESNVDEYLRYDRDQFLFCFSLSNIDLIFSSTKLLHRQTLFQSHMIYITSLFGSVILQFLYDFKFVRE